ncbi:serine/threonine-protein phosphatase 6 regulatory ankyrin repeat subunit B-like [Macrobrachium rosenbergii]|uniref:serine/threonine-protein phosphatase 6 regulatory ankyrin repeat subunit B-like n=1 Tax=Macrobrachium rosenbergii TaxID=79674 RepID=UPI0034D772DA
MGDNSIGDATQVLVAGVLEGDSEQVEKILKMDVDLQVLTVANEGAKLPLLGLAAYLGHHHLVAPLVSAGADANAKDSLGLTPLIHAARESHGKVLRELVKAGADINATASEKEMRNSVLHTCTMKSDEESVSFLLSQKGVNVSPQDDSGYTPLHVAAVVNNVRIINLLVDAGADRNLRTVHGCTPLHIASMSGSLEAVKRLLELKFDIYAVDNEGRTACDLADERGMSEVYWFFIKKAGQIEKTILTPPQKSEQSYEIEEWILDWATSGHNDTLPMLQYNHPSQVDSYYQDKRGYTILHMAAEKGNRDMLQLLLERCVIYAGIVDRKDRTAADVARERGFYHLAEYIESFLSHPQTKEEKESLYLELLELIGQGDEVKKASALLSRGAPVEPFGQHSHHALVVAITANRRRILSLLLAAGAPITTVFQGLNVLQIAWISPQISTYTRMIITRTVAHVLEEELSRVDESRTELRAGINHIMEKVKSDTPWIARWPDNDTGKSEFLQKAPLCNGIVEPSHVSTHSSDHLTHLMVQAVQSNCSLTVGFLHQAGGIPFAVDAHSEMSPFTMAITCHHWSIVCQLAKGSACLYIPDSSGHYPRDFVSIYYMRELEKEVFDREARNIEDELEKAKEQTTKDEFKRIQELHSSLFNIYMQNDQARATVHVTDDLMAETLLLASQQGLSQLIHLLLEVAQLDVNLQVEKFMGTTALHQAAAFGHSDLCTLLKTRGASVDAKDHFLHTPAHFAAMFGHETAYKQLIKFMENPESENLSNNTPKSIRNNFCVLLDQYGVLDEFLEVGDDVFTCSDPAEAEKKKLDQMPLSYIVQQSQHLCVNFSEGEAAEVKAVVTAELEKIKDKIFQVNPLFTGNLELLGSAADKTRLHAPDEFDFNFCVDMEKNLTLHVADIGDKKEALLKGHSKYLKVSSQDQTVNALLQKSNWKDEFFRAVAKSLEGHAFSDSRLSLVPPGVTRTQVGVGISLSWQGLRYPILLIGIDLVPVLKASWPENLKRPHLTPLSVSHVYISSIGDGEWRLSFANLEADILKSLEPEELEVYLTCKTLLSCMKAEPWMPKAIKNKFTWWSSRRWKIPIPSGFALKNCFLRRLEEKKRNGTTWGRETLACHMLSIFQLMVEKEFYKVTGINGLVGKKIYAYFGGEFEKPKLGEGSLEIIRYLEKYCK